MKKRFLSLLLACLTGALCLCLSACGLPDGEVEISLEDIAEVNSLETLLDRYNNILIEEDTVSINGFVESTTYYSFEEADGRFICDIWEESEEHRMAVNARGGILYGMYNEELTAIIVPDAAYNDRVEQMYPLLPTPEEEVLSAVKEEKEILVTTVRETFADGRPSLGVEYRLNARTLRINSLQVISYNEKGQKKQIIGMTVTRNSKEDPDRSAWEAITDPADGVVCVVTAVIEPGTPREETRNLQVTRACSIQVAGEREYDLFSDEACQTQIPLVDATGGSVTFYAKASE